MFRKSDPILAVLIHHRQRIKAAPNTVTTFGKSKQASARGRVF